ncbi:hypothetical protein [Winogradskyella sp.]
MQNNSRKIVANAERNQIITGVGKSINLPKAPDVLINNVARVSQNK